MHKQIGNCCALIVGVMLTVGTSSACRARLAPGVTCDGIRTLKSGMTPEEVSKILGPPVRSGFLAEPHVNDTPLLWGYNSNADSDLFGGLRFELRFINSKLTRAALHAIPLRDSPIMTKGNSKSTLLYWLDDNGSIDESAAFSEYLTCR